MNAITSACAVLVVVSLPLFTTPVLAQSPAKSCDELKTEIAAKMDPKGVKGYTLEAVDNDQVKDAKVVGSCGGGTKKIVYKKG